MELMKFLHCPINITFESFQPQHSSTLAVSSPLPSKQNFELVAELLYWLLQRYDLGSSVTDNSSSNDAATSSSCDDENYKDDDATVTAVTRTERIQTCIDSESDRIKYVKQAVLYFHDHANIQLDPKAIYAADATSIKELIKVAKLIVDAVKIESEYRGCQSKVRNQDHHVNEEGLFLFLQPQGIKEGKMMQEKEEGTKQQIGNFFDVDQQQKEEVGPRTRKQEEMKKEDDNINTLQNISLASMEQDMKLLATLGPKLTESAARLHALLSHEEEFQKQMKMISTFLMNHQQHKKGDAENGGDASYYQHEKLTIELLLKEQLHEIQQEFSSLKEKSELLEADKHDIHFELNNKKKELERNHTRLRNLQLTRPSFMDEYESLEIDLQKHYDYYMERYRNIHYLKHELKSVEQQEQVTLEKLRKKTLDLQAKLQEDEQRSAMFGDDGQFIANNVINHNSNSSDESQKNVTEISPAPNLLHQNVIPVNINEHPKNSSSYSSHSMEKNTCSHMSSKVLNKKNNYDIHVSTNENYNDKDNHEKLLMVKDGNSISGDSCRSNALIVSHCTSSSVSEPNTNKSMESSFSRTSISVDSSTYFLGDNDLKSFNSPTSRSSLSGDENDDNF
jgi:hypothetical protein